MINTRISVGEEKTIGGEDAQMRAFYPGPSTLKLEGNKEGRVIEKTVRKFQQENKGYRFGDGRRTFHVNQV